MTSVEVLKVMPSSSGVEEPGQQRQDEGGTLVFSTGQQRHQQPRQHQQQSPSQRFQQHQQHQMLQGDGKSGPISLDRLSNLAELSSMRLASDLRRASNLSNSGLMLPRLTDSARLSNLSNPRSSGLSFLLGQQAQQPQSAGANASAYATQSSNDAYPPSPANNASGGSNNANDRFLRFTGLGMGLDRPSNLSQGIGRFTSHLLLDTSASNRNPSNLAEHLGRLSNFGLGGGSSSTSNFATSASSASSEAAPPPFVTGRAANRPPPPPSVALRTNMFNAGSSSSSSSAANNNSNGNHSSSPAGGDGAFFTGVRSAAAANLANKSGGVATYGASSPTESVRTSGLSLGRDFADASADHETKSKQTPSAHGNLTRIGSADASKHQQHKTKESKSADSPRDGAPAISRAELSAGLHSLELFLRFVKEYADPQNPSRVIIDTSQILSSECYESWIATRRGSLKKPEESFRRALTAHVTGADRRRPFPPPVEASLLVELRKQKTWACFENRMSQNENKPIKIGEQGFRTQGFHERKASEAKDSQQRLRRPLTGAAYNTSPILNAASAPVHPAPVIPGRGADVQPFITGQDPSSQHLASQHQYSRNMFPPAMQQHLERQQQHQQHDTSVYATGSDDNKSAAARGSTLSTGLQGFLSQSLLDGLHGSSSPSVAPYRSPNLLNRAGTPPYGHVYSSQSSPANKRKDRDNFESGAASDAHAKRFQYAPPSSSATARLS